MRLLSPEPTTQSNPPSAVTIGNFDGVHLGHLALIERTLSRAELLPTVLTFQPHPVRILAPEIAPPLISTLSDKRQLLANAGIQQILEQPFDRAFAGMSPHLFAQRILHDRLNAHHVIVGYNFTFGAHRAGSVDTLRTLGAQLGFSVEIVKPVSVNGLIVSSSKVREFILSGQVADAQRILGRYFSVEGEVVVGQQRGRLLGFPTANIESTNELLPKIGVYAGWLAWDGVKHPAAINIGFNPTFEGLTQPRIEAHVIDETALSLYGRACRVFFHSRIRDEQKFDGVEALKQQIRLDSGEALARVRS